MSTTQLRRSRVVGGYTKEMFLNKCQMSIKRIHLRSFFAGSRTERQTRTIRPQIKWNKR